ncbi:hypothetical protein A3842_10965 [Paenibacillus sp. P3E]|uniref:helix-turn-helix domain-containing protein n=1 Tax=Paenibacillus sp. P3E TaxID=1349435 RepID=UPI00093AB538|nr:helix-turn-helix transcriptional regulator [Paenibacillus sp. P3E]OKP81594.1 hypothetical protein A3842_10965 [Paenibacillus sp. P3E]
MNNTEFGLYLRKKREERKLSIRQLNTYSGVSHSYISQLERGNRGIPSPDVLKKLSKPLAVDYKELMIQAGHMENTGIINEEKTKEDLIYESKMKIADEIIKLPEEKRKIIEELLRTFKNN